MASPTSTGLHPSFGGKSLDTLTQAPRAAYKSWRKKYRKMRTRFDTVLEENKRMFRDEQKLEDLARRLQEELDTMMEIMLELNQSPGLPEKLRYDVRAPHQLSSQHTLNVVAHNIKPDDANLLMHRYEEAVRNGNLPTFEVHFVREQILDRLAEQGVRPLSALETRLLPENGHSDKLGQLQQDLERYQKESDPDEDPSYLTAEHEDAYLARLDAKINGSDQIFTKPERPAHQAELTPRELERQLELLNPQSQNNWLRSHPRSSAINAEEVDEAVAKGSTRKRAWKGSLAKSLGDRMIRDGRSPSEASGIGYEDELAADEYLPGPGRKKAVDKDPSFRGKLKTKRKRVTDDAASASKRMRTSDRFD